MLDVLRRSAVHMSADRLKTLQEGVCNLKGVLSGAESWQHCMPQDTTHRGHAEDPLHPLIICVLGLSWAQNLEGHGGKAMSMLRMVP
eukprot:1158122-Pelagomonas_calceolata.AAC.8